MNRRDFMKTVPAVAALPLVTGVLFPALLRSKPPLVSAAQLAEARFWVENHRIEVMPDEFEYDMRPGYANVPEEEANNSEK